MPTQIQLRRDTAADWSSANTTLAAGEFGWESDTNKFKIGDGSTAWNSLGYTSEKFDSITITDNTIKTNVSNANLELDANGSGKVSLSGILFPTSDGSADQVLKTDGSGNLGFVTQSGGVSLSGSTNNTVATVTGSNALAGESNLTFDGTTLAVTGAITATTSIANDAISIDDNVIKSTRSNDNLFLEASGTGTIEIKGNILDFSGNTRWQHGANIVHDGGTINPNAMTSSSDRKYSNNTISLYKFDGTNSAQSHSRFRQGNIIHIDANGSSLTSTGYYKGPSAHYNVVEVDNTSSTDVTFANMNGYMCEPYIYSYTGGAGDITVSELNGFLSVPFVETADSNHTVTLTDVKHFRAQPVDKSGAGTETVTSEYGFFMGGSGSATNTYAFYSENDAYESRIGTLERYREKINSLTSSSTITVDCGLAPVHKVTLASNTQFNISSLATGQSVTLIIVQDGGGGNTASFGTDGSTAVKFPGGAPTLSTAGNAIDIVTVFNDGTNFYGNCAKAYA